VSDYDTTKVIQLISLTKDYTGYDNERAMEYANNAIEIASKINYLRGLGNAYYRRSVIYYYLSEYKKAEEDLQKSLVFRNQARDEKGLADIYLMQGIILDAYYQHDKAIEIFFKAIEKYEKIKDKEGLSAAYGNIATSYNILNDCNNAIRYQQKSLKLAFELKDDESIAISYFDMAMCYDKMNVLNKALMLYDSADYYYNKVGKIQGKGTILNSKGLVYKKKKMYDKAEECYQKAIQIHRSSQNKYGLANTLVNIGELKLITGNADKAIEFLNEALAISTETGNVEFICNSFKYLSLAYKQLQQYKKALEYFEKYAEIKDTSAINDIKNRMLKLQAYYNDEQKENEILLLNQSNKIKEIQIKKQRYLIWFSIIILLFLTSLIYLWYKKYTEKKRLNAILNDQNIKIQGQKEEIEKQKYNIEQQAIQLKELNDYKSKFYENISHEFRTPLTLIKSPLEQLLKETNDSSSKNLYHIMYRNVILLENNINNLLQLAKIEKKEISVNFQQFNINELLKGIVSNFEYEAKQRDITIELTEENNFSIISGDLQKVEAIFINLIGNAIKYCNNNSTINVTINNSDTHIIISVIDNGPGISVEHLPHIFDRFYKGNDKGIGLGLNIVKEYVELNNGKISVFSELNKGTEFKIEFPVSSLSDSEKNCEPLLSEDFQEKIINNNESDKYTILIVEDNKDMQNYLIHQLNSNFNIITASDGNEGLQKALKYYPDCIICDIMMPLMDGYEMTYKVKNDILLSHIPVILLSAKASESSIIKGMQAEADEYITKPFKINELIARINNIIKNRIKLKEKFEKNKYLNPSEIIAESMDQKFLSKAISIVEDNISSSEFDVAEFCKKMGISRTNMHRKIKAITNQSTTEFIKSIRMKRAAQLIEQQTGNISEIAYQVGYDNLSYFTRCFKEYFNVAPSEYKNYKLQRDIFDKC
jgi:signal transduction histidine kinase/DNA-binding response OmpR family regulator